MLCDQITHCCRELLARHVRALGLEDPRVRLHDLPDRPERDASAVRQRASLTPDNEVGILVDDAIELVNEAALAHARHADERDELWLAFRPRT